MNNRPITYQGEDVQRALTPSDLINGQTLPQIAEELVENDHQESNNATKRYRYISKKRDDLWNRWNREYVVTLRQYHKMTKSKGREITEGEVVMVSSNNHRSKWKLGVVESLIKSHDGIVKGARIRVIVKEKPKIMERSVQHLNPLEIRLENGHLTDQIADSIQSLEMGSKRDRRLTAVGARERIRDIMSEDQDEFIL